MDLEYSGKHSVNFFRTINNVQEKRNSWKDFHLIPSKRPHIVYPEPNLMMIVLPGTNKRMDITDFHTGGLTFGPRSGSWTFYIDHTKVPEWPTVPRMIEEFLHGQSCYISLEDEPILFYSGVLKIGSYKAGESFSEITIDYDLAYDSFISPDDLGSPIKFIGSNGIMYANDYGFPAGASYISDTGVGTSSVLAYNLSVLNGG